jgi:hypothetical protein
LNHIYSTRKNHIPAIGEVKSLVMSYQAQRVSGIPCSLSVEVLKIRDGSCLTFCSLASFPSDNELEIT